MNSRRTLTRLSVFALTIGVLATPALAHNSHKVGPGETLSQIAMDAGTSTAVLMAENGLSDPNRIRVGQVLSIPTTHKSSASAGTQSVVPQATPAVAVASGGVYTVVRGDTLGGIAVKLKVRRASLMELNSIADPNRIRVGQVLNIPGSSAVPQVVPQAAPASPPSTAGGSYPNMKSRITADAAKSGLIPHFEKWASVNGLAVDYLMAVAWHESGWNNTVVSSKGAVGIGQIMPRTGVWIASDLIGDPSLDSAVAEDNIRMSARYLRYLISYLGSEDLALAGYYQGPGAVKAGIRYSSTDHYVASVNANRRFFSPS